MLINQLLLNKTTKTTSFCSEFARRKESHGGLTHARRPLKRSSSIARANKWKNIKNNGQREFTINLTRSFTKF